MKTCSCCNYPLASDGECYELTCTGIEPWEQTMIDECDAHELMDMLLSGDFE